jgi:hypothetical protein
MPREEAGDYMAINFNDVQVRAAELEKRLSTDIWHEVVRAKGDYWVAVILMIITLGSSCAAGLGGLAFHWTVQSTAIVALIPGAAAIIATTMKFEAKSNWHYTKLYALDGLKSRLKLELPENPSVGDVAALSQERRELIKKMKSEWDATLLLNWSQFKVPGHQDHE